MNMFNRLIVAGLLGILGCSMTYAGQGQTMLILDMRNSPELPKHFHTTTDTLSAPNIDTRGLAELQIAGGSQFSKLSFDSILQRLRSKKIIVVDLRQESHGLLNSNAVSWYGGRNNSNQGLSNQAVEKAQSDLLTDLNDAETAVVNTVLQKDDAIIKKTKAVEYAVHQVSSEEEYVNERGSVYKRLYVQDFHAPKPSEVDRFIEMTKTFPPHQWIYFHCHAGSGRTTTFMLIYDMMHNAKKVSLEDILTRQAALGGKDMNMLPKTTSFKYKFAVERLNFVKQFYRYAKENHDDFATTYSEWLSSQGK